MGKKLPPDQLVLYKRIDELLWSDWDPIGVYGVPEARDEYHSYLPAVFALAMRPGDVAEIADYLHAIETVNMGLGGSRERCRLTAEKICQAQHEFVGPVGN